MEMDKYFEELNDMANFKNFGEAVKDKEFIDNPVIAYKKLQQENAELKGTIDAYQMSENEAKEIIAELKAELQKFKDMAKKGLDEFKDVGGCWGCGLQLQLNQDMEDIKQLNAENERLKEENKLTRQMHKDLMNKLFEFQKIEDTLQEIKVIVKGVRNYLEVPTPRDVRYEMDRILDLITKSESEG